MAIQKGTRFNDNLLSGPGDSFDVIDGLTGTDTIDYSSYTGNIVTRLSIGLRSTGTSFFPDFAGGSNVELLVSIENVTGGSGNNSLSGNEHRNTLKGNDGNDSLFGVGGNDILDGGNGDDSLVGGAGNDTLVWSNGRDTLAGGEGIDTVVFNYDSLTGGIRANLQAGLAIVTGDLTDTAQLSSIENLTGGSGYDVLTGDKSDNTLMGGDGDDLLYGLAGNDLLDGGNGNDNLNGQKGSDIIDGGNGNDNLDGGADNDTLVWSNGRDILAGGEGIDTVVFNYDSSTGGVVANLQKGLAAVPSNSTDTAQLSSIENLTGGSGNDTLLGSESNNTLKGNDGDDLLYGLGGNDILDGGNGNDSLDGGAGKDTLNGGIGLDTLVGGVDADTFVLNKSSESLTFIQDFNRQEGDKIRVSGSEFNIGSSDFSQFSYNSNRGILGFKGTQLAFLNPATQFNPTQDIKIVDRDIVNFNLDFSTSNQSIWDTGKAFSFTDNRSLEGSWNGGNEKTWEFEVKEEILGKDVGVDVEATVSGSSSGTAGLESKFQIEGGSVNASLPINLWIDVPEQVKAGQQVTIKSGFSLNPNAIFSTFNPNVTYDLDLKFGMKAKLDISADAGILGEEEATIFDVNIPETITPLPIFDGEDGIQIKDTWLKQFGSVDLHIPDIDTTGALKSGSKNTLSASGSDTFFEGTLDLDNLATKALNLAGVPVPPLEAEVSIPKLPSKLSPKVEYNILDTELVPKLALSQEFDLFAEGMKGQLTIEGIDTPIDFTVGQDVTFTMPDGVGDSLGVMAVVGLDADFSNKTTLSYDVDFDVEALQGYVKMKSLGTQEFGPLYDPPSLNVIDGDIADIYNQTFALGGLNSQSFNFDIGVVV